MPPGDLSLSQLPATDSAQGLMLGGGLIASRVGIPRRGVQPLLVKGNKPLCSSPSGALELLSGSRWYCFSDEFINIYK